MSKEIDENKKSAVILIVILIGTIGAIIAVIFYISYNRGYDKGYDVLASNNSYCPTAKNICTLNYFEDYDVIERKFQEFSDFMKTSNSTTNPYYERDLKSVWFLVRMDFDVVDNDTMKITTSFNKTYTLNRNIVGANATS